MSVVNTSTRSYQPSSEIPIINKRQKRMLRALQLGIDDLADTVYTMAREDLGACQAGHGDGQQHIPGQIAALQTIIQDGNHEKRREMAKLFHTIHKSVLEAIILNTIGHRAKTDLKNFQYPTDGCAGVYILTFSVNGTSKGLTPSQWTEVQAMIQNYSNSRGVAVTNTSSSVDQSLADAASKVDLAIKRRHEDPVAVLKDSRDGWRELNFPAIDTFCALLDGRIGDGGPDTQQIQVPIQVGCSMGLASRMSQHDPTGDLKNASKPWSLLLSCLKVMNIQVDFIALPILKIWKEIQLPIAELGLTFIGGSLVCHGGFNAIAAGTRRGEKDEEKFQRAARQIFVNAGWTLENLARSEKVTKERNDALVLYQAFQDGKNPVEEEWSGVRTRIDKWHIQADDFHTVVSNTTHDLATRYEENKLSLRNLTMALSRRVGDLAFSSKLIGWLKGEKQEGGGSDRENTT